MSRDDRFPDLMRAFFYEWLSSSATRPSTQSGPTATPGGYCFGSLHSVLGRRWL